MAIRDTPALNDDQHGLQDTLRGFLAGQLPSAALHAALETEAGYSAELHARLAPSPVRTRTGIEYQLARQRRQVAWRFQRP